MISARIKNLWLLLFLCLGVWACSKAQVLKSEHSEDLGKIKEYDESLKIKILEPIVTPSPTPGGETPQTGGPSVTGAPTPTPTPTPVESKKKKGKSAKPSEAVIPLLIPAKIKGPRPPDFEDPEGFQGRRPIVDPFHVGEKIVLSLSYFNIVAGDMTIEVLPFAEVNGRKAYHFRVSIKSNSFFSTFYAVDDWAQTFVDYEEMIPYNFEIHVKESKQLREVRSFFDWRKLKAKFWERRITAENGTENKDINWDIQNYTQNVFSAVYYLRTFRLKPGKTVAMRVADEGRNMMVKGVIVKKDLLKTDLGELKTIVMRPEIQMGGIFQPVGDINFWLTDDDQKQLVRIESKIKIGTIVGSLKSIDHGRTP